MCTRDIFHQSNVVKMPSNLNFLEATMLTCSGLTTWNALFGLEGKTLKKGQTVLIQGTGGVSIAALQFAVALGATVIATTSSNDKIERLKKLGAHHVINYRLTPDWGQVAKKLTLDGNGVDLVVDVGGSATLSQSVLALKTNGLIASAGVLGGPPDPYAPNVPNLLAGIMYTLTARDFYWVPETSNAMNRFVETNDVKPALDDRIFELSELKDAYQHMERQAHFSKIAIRI